MTKSSYKNINFCGGKANFLPNDKESSSSLDNIIEEMLKLSLSGLSFSTLHSKPEVINFLIRLFLKLFTAL